MFIALRHLNTKHGQAKPGDYIPSADGWSHGVQVSEVNCGNVFDLSRVVKLDDWNSPTQHKREKDLLSELQKYGKQVVVGDDGVYHCNELNPSDGEPPRRKARRNG